MILDVWGGSLLFQDLRHRFAIDIARGNRCHSVAVLMVVDDAEQKLQPLLKDLLHSEIDGRNRRRHKATEGIRPVVGREKEELLSDTNAGFVHRSEQAARNTLIVAVEDLLQLAFLDQTPAEFIAVFRRALTHELALGHLQA